MSECFHVKRTSKLFCVYSFPYRWLRRGPHHVHAPISVNLVVFQGLMRTPQDCKVMWVAACNFFATEWFETSHILQNLVIFIWNYPYWFTISSQRLSYCNVKQNSCRPTTVYLSLSGVDLLAHFLLLIDCDSNQENELISSQLCQAHVRRCTRLMINY